MAAKRSVTIWIRDLKAGDATAARRIWQRYSRRLLGLARRKLTGSKRRIADEEDIAQSAFHSLWRGATEGRFSNLQQRDDLWSLLAVITSRKAYDQQQYDLRQKRGGGAVRGESVWDCAAGDSKHRGISQYAVDDDSTVSTAVAKELHERLLDRLADATLRQIAVWKMESFTDEEIAEKLGCSRSTVVRKLSLIRKIWMREGPR